MPPITRASAGATQTTSGDAAQYSAIEKRGGKFLAQWISGVAIFPCEGARDAASEASLAEAFKVERWREVTRLYRRNDVPAEQCWLRARDWCLAYR